MGICSLRHVCGNILYGIYNDSTSPVEELECREEHAFEDDRKGQEEERFARICENQPAAAPESTLGLTMRKLRRIISE